MAAPPRAAEDEGPSSLGCAAALRIGVLVVAVVNFIVLLSDGAPLLTRDWDFYLVETLMIATPFGLMALTGIRARLPWLVGLALTVALWGYFLFDRIAAQSDPDRAGMNFLLAPILMASPLIISFACFAAFGWQYDRRRRKARLGPAPR